MLAWACSSSVERPVAPAHPALLRPERPLVIAHRGGVSLGPEETLPTFRKALEAGADVLELDLRATADGTLVCLHDETVDRTTDGTGLVAELSFDALRALDAGGAPVPTLDEVLSAFPTSPFVVEIKQQEPPIWQEVVATIEAHDALDRVVVAAFSADVLDAARAAQPRLMTGLAVTEVLELWLLDDDDDWVAPGRFVQVPPEAKGLSVVDASLLHKAERLGLAVQPWTINDPDEMDRLLQLGVHGIMTDRPDVLAERVRLLGP